MIECDFTKLYNSPTDLDRGSTVCINGHPEAHRACHLVTNVTRAMGFMRFLIVCFIASYSLYETVVGYTFNSWLKRLSCSRFCGREMFHEGATEVP